MSNPAEPPQLEREVFTTSRELEYFSASELVTQTGYARYDWWPGMVVKESLDNSLDACEEGGRAPQITVTFGGTDLTVSDNGPGIPRKVVANIQDFSSRTSSKAAYVSPTRGAQGNALKTILAIPYVMNEGPPAVVQVEACGLRHVITISTNQIAHLPKIDHRWEEIVKSTGTSIHLRLDSASSETTDSDPGFLQKLLFDYSLFNPHAAFSLRQKGIEEEFPATEPAWHKWRPSDPTSPHWYSVERFEELVASYIAMERRGGEPLTVAEFVDKFRGLSGSKKQRQIIIAAGLERTHLRDLLSTPERLDRPRLQRLLDVMQKASKLVKPEMLGVLGEHHFRSRLQRWEDDESFRYKCLKGIDDEGLPYVVECAFAMTEEDSLLQGAHMDLTGASRLATPSRREIDLSWMMEALLMDCRHCCGIDGST